MIGRRGLLVCGTALAGTSPTISPALPPVLAFDVVRDGNRVGQHQVAFRQDGGMVTATIAVEIIVRLGPIVLYRYNHNGRETWRDGEFESLTTETNDSGTRFKVSMTRTAANVVVDSGSRPPAAMPRETIPLTHWNARCMERPLVNPQDGVPVTSSVVVHGEDTVGLANGQMVRARHFSLVGVVTLDDWYDATPLWTALRTKAHDGSTVEYRRVT